MLRRPGHKVGEETGAEPAPSFGNRSRYSLSSRNVDLEWLVEGIYDLGWVVVGLANDSSGWDTERWVSVGEVG